MKHKEHYNDEYVLELSSKLYSVMPHFNSQNFCSDLIGNLDDKELFARFDCIVDAMEKSMGNDYMKNIQTFYELLGPELTQPEGMFNLDGGSGLLGDTLNVTESKTGRSLWLS